MKSSWFVAENGLRVTPDGLQIEVRLPWYRALQLSTIDFTEVTINGRSVDVGHLMVDLNGKKRSVNEITQFYEEFWYVLDSAYLRIPYPGAKPEESYDIQVTLMLYPPYIPGVPFRCNFSQRMRAN